MQIIPRTQWGARYARGFRAAPLPARELYLHHSVTAAPAATLAAEYAAVRTLEQIGQDRFGGGISYTFVVAPSGRVYEGHGIDRQGAHTGGRNSIARAICLIGNYDINRPPPAMVQAVADLVRHGAAQRWWPNRLTGGHRDAPGASTACPGRHAYALIGEMNRLAAGAAPSNPPAPPAQGDDMPTPADLWQHPIRDEYTATPNDVMPAHAALAWVVARSTWAMEAAKSADARGRSIEGKLDALAAALAAQPAPDGGTDLARRLDAIESRLSALEARPQ